MVHENRFEITDRIQKTQAIKVYDEGCIYTTAHIFGGERIIATTDASTNEQHDYYGSATNHWKLYLGMTNSGKDKIWNILSNIDVLSTDIWKIVFDFVDVIFGGELMTCVYKPYDNQI